VGLHVIGLLFAYNISIYFFLHFVYTIPYIDNISVVYHYNYNYVRSYTIFHHMQRCGHPLALSPPLTYISVYLWDIPTVSLYLAISNHAAAAAVLSLTLSSGLSSAPLYAVVSFISNHLAPSPLHHSHRRQSPHLCPTLPRVHPLPQQPAVYPGGRRHRPCSIKPHPRPLP